MPTARILQLGKLRLREHKYICINPLVVRNTVQTQYSSFRRLVMCSGILSPSALGSDSELLYSDILSDTLILQCTVSLRKNNYWLDKLSAFPLYGIFSLR